MLSGRGAINGNVACCCIALRDEMQRGISQSMLRASIPEPNVQNRPIGYPQGKMALQQCRSGRFWSSLSTDEFRGT